MSLRRQECMSTFLYKEAPPLKCRKRKGHRGKHRGLYEFAVNGVADSEKIFWHVGELASPEPTELSATKIGKPESGA